MNLISHKEEGCRDRSFGQNHPGSSVIINKIGSFGNDLNNPTGGSGRIGGKKMDSTARHTVQARLAHNVFVAGGMVKDWRNFFQGAVSVNELQDRDRVSVVCPRPSRNRLQWRGEGLWMDKAESFLIGRQNLAKLLHRVLW